MWPAQDRLPKADDVDKNGPFKVRSVAVSDTGIP
jgi:hypothetical protein